MRFCKRHTIAHAEDKCPICALQDDIESIKDHIQDIQQDADNYTSNRLDKIIKRLNKMHKKGWNS